MGRRLGSAPPAVAPRPFHLLHVRGYPRPGNVVTRSPLPPRTRPPRPPGGAGRRGGHGGGRPEGRARPRARSAPSSQPRPSTTAGAPPLCSRSAYRLAPPHWPLSAPPPSSVPRPLVLAPPPRCSPTPSSALRPQRQTFLVAVAGVRRELGQHPAARRLRSLWRLHASWSRAVVRALSFPALRPQSTVPGSPHPALDPHPPPPGSNGRCPRGSQPVAAQPCLSRRV